MMNRSQTAGNAKHETKAAKSVVKGEAIMKSIISSVLAVLVLTGISVAKELPNAPSAVAAANGFIEAAPVTASAPKFAVENKPVVDATFLSLALVSTGSTFADSYTTLFARQNWLAGKTNVCNMESQSAYLYGTHPTVGRAYAVASVKSAGSIFAAYYLRKHHNKFWSLPLVANSIVGLEGVTQNLRSCN
jgi:hypothetical protein